MKSFELFSVEWLYFVKEVELDLLQCCLRELLSIGWAEGVRGKWSPNGVFFFSLSGQLFLTFDIKELGMAVGGPLNSFVELLRKYH